MGILGQLESDPTQGFRKLHKAQSEIENPQVLRQVLAIFGSLANQPNVFVGAEIQPEPQFGGKFPHG
jgi:hypothetical protein